MEEMIKVIVKEPGKDPEDKMVKNELHALQEIVGGLIEVVPIGNGVLLVANEEGKIRDLPFNCKIAGRRIFWHVLPVWRWCSGVYQFSR